MEASGPTSWTSIRSRTCNWTVQSSILNIWIHLVRSFAGSRRDILRWCARLRKAQLVLSLTLREEIDSLVYAYFISWCGELTLRCWWHVALGGPIFTEDSRAVLLREALQATSTVLLFVTLSGCNIWALTKNRVVHVCTRLYLQESEVTPPNFYITSG